MSPENLRRAILDSRDTPMREQLPYHLQLMAIALAALEPYPDVHRRAQEMVRLFRAYAGGVAVDPKRFEEMRTAIWPHLGKRFSDEPSAKKSSGYLASMASYVGFDAFERAGRLDEASREMWPIDHTHITEYQDWFNEYFDALEAAGLL